MKRYYCEIHEVLYEVPFNFEFLAESYEEAQMIVGDIKRSRGSPKDCETIIEEV